jgi:1-acyl-sn-glycerol-3-phosphate acyltransferase
LPIISILLAAKGTVGTRARYLWRVIRTALGFGTFGAGALLIALGLFPLVRCLPGDHERRAQRLVHLGFRAWIRLASGLGLFRVAWRGRERLRQPRGAVIVANHPTLIDVVLLIACLPQADCVVKRAAWRNPFLRWVVAGAGYVRNDDARGTVEACAARLRRGRCLVLFPEGTRSPRLGLHPFRRGAAHAALRSGAPLLPVVITCDPPTLMKGQRWYDVPDRTPRFTLAVGAPIRPRAHAARGQARGRAARALTAELQAFYVRRLRHGRPRRSRIGTQAAHH